MPETSREGDSLSTGHGCVGSTVLDTPTQSKVYVENKYQKKYFVLNKPNQALFVSKKTWREIQSLEKGTVLCVLASLKFDEGDYIRSYSEFKKN